MSNTAPSTRAAPTAHDPHAAFHQPRRWLVLLSMTGSLSMIFMDMTVVGIALPSIGADLHMSTSSQTWMMSAYLLALASLVALGGRVGDLTGKVPAFVIGVIGFAAASALCGAANSGAMLIAGRVLQGVAACLMQPASAALVVSSFAHGERGKAMAVYVGIPLLFMALGPWLGGVLVQHAGWRWIFYLNLPVALAAVVLTFISRPRDVRNNDRHIDWLGGVLLLVGLPLFVYGLQELGELRPWGSAVSTGATSYNAIILGALVAGAILVAVFARMQWSSQRPLLRLRLFTDRPLRGSALVIGFMQCAMAGLLIQGSIYAQEVLGYEPERAGASILPMMLPVILLVHVAGRWYDRVGVRRPAVFGTALVVLGLWLQSGGQWVQSYPIMAVGMFIMGSGIAFAMSPSNTDSLSRVNANDRGQVSGLVQTLRQVGNTTGVALTAATIVFAQSQVEYWDGRVTHQRVQELRTALRARDHDARQEAQHAPDVQEVRTVVAHSMAIGGFAASLPALAAFACAYLLLPRKTAAGEPVQRPSSPR